MERRVEKRGRRGSAESRGVTLSFRVNGTEKELVDKHLPANTNINTFVREIVIGVLEGKEKAK